MILRRNKTKTNIQISYGTGDMNSKREAGDKDV